MDRALLDENTQLRALLNAQQQSLRQMAEYNRLLSQRVAAYAGEINRLKALVVKLQHMQFGKSSEKLHQKTECQVSEAQEEIRALQKEMDEVLGEQPDPAMPQSLRKSSARKPLPASLPRETRTLPPAEITYPACGGGLIPLGCHVSEQLERIALLRLSKRNGQNWPVAGLTISFRLPCHQNPSNATTRALVCWRALSPRSLQNIRLTIASRKYTAVRAWS